MKALEELQKIYQLPLPELIFRAAQVHRAHHDISDIQRCALLSIKTGGCPEDCGYCAQSARYKTGVEATQLMSLEEVRERAQKAKQLGATRFCMGTAWRGLPARPWKTRCRSIRSNLSGSLLLRESFFRVPACA